MHAKSTSTPFAIHAPRRSLFKNKTLVDIIVPPYWAEIHCFVCSSNNEVNSKAISYSALGYGHAGTVSTYLVTIVLLATTPQTLFYPANLTFIILNKTVSLITSCARGRGPRDDGLWKPVHSAHCYSD